MYNELVHIPLQKIYIYGIYFIVVSLHRIIAQKI